MGRGARAFTVCKATHCPIEQLHYADEKGCAALLQQMLPDIATESRNLAYWLYNICERES